MPCHQPRFNFQFKFNHQIMIHSDLINVIRLPLSQKIGRCTTKHTISQVIKQNFVDQDTSISERALHKDAGTGNLVTHFFPGNFACFW